MEISLRDRVAVVTGAGPNIGSGIALALARYGAKVACVDLREENARASAERAVQGGGEALALTGDVTDEQDVIRYQSEILDCWGKIDILVNNAALMGGYAGVLDETPETFTKSVLVSGLGSLLNTKHAARSMAEREIRGSIVCISSSTGWTASAGYVAYAFHKGGINNFVRAAAMDLAPYGIRVNGFTPTAPTPDNPEYIAARAAAGRSNDPLSYSGVSAGMDEPWRRPTRWSGARPPMAPMGSTGTPSDIGHCVAWICSDYARLITGVDFVVDGGTRAKNPMYHPADPEDLAGPIPLVALDPNGAAPSM